MTVRLLLAAVTLVCVATGAAGAAAQQQQYPLPKPSSKPADSIRASKCAKKGSKTLKANRQARVFASPRPPAQGTVYGCLRTANRAFRLGLADGECQNNDTVAKLELAGRRAALGKYECSLYSASWGVRLVNLRTGRTEFINRPLGDPQPENGSDSLHRIVVTPEGAVAWTASRSIGGSKTVIEVRRRRRGSVNESVLIDGGAGIDPDSLRKRGHVITWTKAGVKRSAKI